MKLHIPIKIWQRIQYYTQLSLPHEITGIGTINIIDAENLEVTEIFLPRQTANTCSCDFADDALHEIIYDLMETAPERVEQLRFRWHSHAHGQVFWSSRDEQDIDSWDGPWVVNLVVNAEGKYLARLDIFDPLRLHECPIEIVLTTEDDDHERTTCQQEIAERVQIVDDIIPTGPSRKHFTQRILL